MIIVSHRIQAKQCVCSYGVLKMLGVEITDILDQSAEFGVASPLLKASQPSESLSRDFSGGDATFPQKVTLTQGTLLQWKCTLL